MTVFRLGLTGSIGMGKSTTADFFRTAGVAVWDADAAVHRLYAKGGAAVAPISDLIPAAVTEGFVSRETLKSAIAADPGLLSCIEEIVHPLVAQDRADFLQKTVSDIAVFDVPLLFEKGTEAEMDETLLVTAPTKLQRKRVLSRPGMTEAQLALILSRQLPDAEKRALATHIIETLSLASTQLAVAALIDYIRGGSHA